MSEYRPIVYSGAGLLIVVECEVCAGHVFVSKLMRLFVVYCGTCIHNMCLACTVWLCVRVCTAPGDSFLLVASLYNAPMGKPNGLELVLENFAGIG